MSMWAVSPRLPCGHPPPVGLFHSPGLPLPTARAEHARARDAAARALKLRPGLSSWLMCSAPPCDAARVVVPRPAQLALRGRDDQRSSTSDTERVGRHRERTSRCCRRRWRGREVTVLTPHVS
eukprot:3672436-Prymnesium_polylepis.1